MADWQAIEAANKRFERQAQLVLGFQWLQVCQSFIRYRMLLMRGENCETNTTTLFASWKQRNPTAPCVRRFTWAAWTTATAMWSLCWTICDVLLSQGWSLRIFGEAHHKFFSCLVGDPSQNAHCGFNLISRILFNVLMQKTWRGMNASGGCAGIRWS